MYDVTSEREFSAVETCWKDDHDSVVFNIESIDSVSCEARPSHFSKEKGETAKQAHQAGSMAFRWLKIG
ncbi:MAG: hypothetical protein ACREN8_14155, partial [Candidatus Dormibacteraceae bacterium]